MRRWPARIVVLLSAALTLSLLALGWRSQRHQDTLYFTSRTTFVHLASHAGRIHVLNVEDYPTTQPLTLRRDQLLFESGPHGSMLKANPTMFLIQDRAGGWGPVQTSEGRTLSPPFSGFGPTFAPTGARPTLTDDDLRRLAAERTRMAERNLTLAPPAEDPPPTGFSGAWVANDPFTLTPPLRKSATTRPAKSPLLYGAVTGGNARTSSASTRPAAPSGRVTWSTPFPPPALKKTYRTASIPHTYLAAIVALPAVAIAGFGVRRRFVARRRRARGHCPACGYDLRGSAGVCPECGFGAAIAAAAK